MEHTMKFSPSVIQMLRNSEKPMGIRLWTQNSQNKSIKEGDLIQLVNPDNENDTLTVKVVMLRETNEKSVTIDIVKVK